MKNLLILLSLVCFSNSLFAQQSVRKFYNKYKHGQEVTSVKVQGWLIKSVLAFAEDFEGEELAKKITKLSVLVIENGNTVSKEDFNELVSDAKAEAFEDLMTIRESTRKHNECSLYD
jgi:Holliday junction resolvase